MEQAFSRDIRILVIDEQALAQNYLKFALEKLGYSSVQLTDRASWALYLLDGDKPMIFRFKNIKRSSLRLSPLSM